MRKLILLLAFAGYSWGAYSCSSGTSGGATIVCNVQFSAYHSAIPGVDSSAYYDVFYPTAWGVTNTGRTVVFVHGGGGNGNYTGGGISANYFIDMAQKGWNVYVARYTENFILNLRSAVNIGDTTLAIANYLGAGGLCPNSASPNWQVQVDSEVLTVTGVSNMCTASGTLTVSAAQSAHAATAIPVVVGTQYPVALSDIAKLFSFLGQCAAGGSTYHTGACSSYANVPGDPNQLSIFGTSTGGDYAARFVGIGLCHTGATCTYLNNTVNTPGYSEWTSRNWTLNNPGHVAAWLISPAIDVNVYYEESVLYSQAVTTYQPQVATMQCGCGVYPACTSGWNTGYLTSSTTSVSIPGTFPAMKTFTVSAGLAYVNGQRVRATQTVGANEYYMEGTVSSYSGTTLVMSTTIASSTVVGSSYSAWVIDLPTQKVCGTPSACFTSCASQGVFQNILAGTPMPIPTFQQIGGDDTFWNRTQEMLSLQPNVTTTVTYGLNHCLDWTSDTTPSTSVGYAAFAPAMGVNNCSQLPSTSQCPASNSALGAGVF